MTRVNSPSSAVENQLIEDAKTRIPSASRSRMKKALATMGLAAAFTVAPNAYYEGRRAYGRAMLEAETPSEVLTNIHDSIKQRATKADIIAKNFQDHPNNVATVKVNKGLEDYFDASLLNEDGLLELDGKIYDVAARTSPSGKFHYVAAGRGEGVMIHPKLIGTYLEVNGAKDVDSDEGIKLALQDAAKNLMQAKSTVLAANEHEEEGVDVQIALSNQRGHFKSLLEANTSDTKEDDGLLALK